MEKGGEMQERRRNMMKKKKKEENCEKLGERRGEKVNR